MLLFHGSGIPSAKGQLIRSESYELSVAPDFWYNTVDRAKPGIRFRGEDPRTFLDGPHRLEASIRLATAFPDTPVSWFVSYTHPISFLTSPGNEGAVHVYGSMRAGLHRYEAGLKKRWQPGFDEFVSTDLHFYGGLYKRFDDAYLIYNPQWQKEPVTFLRSYFRKRDEHGLGRWTVHLSGFAGMPVRDRDPFIRYDGQATESPEALGVDGLFGQLTLEGLQQIDLPYSFYTRTRLFAGVSSNSTLPEHRYFVSGASAFTLSESAWTRARGTLPPSWIRDGLLQVPGGPGLRGYQEMTADQLESGMMPWVQHAVSMNVDLYYPNPVDSYFSKIPYLGDLLRLESYLFFDAGFMYDHTEWQDILMNAGAGFMLSLNIADYLGQDRGFFIRYEWPLWLSDAPDGENAFSFRHLLGLGAHYRF
ncbi:hypothetical protein QLX67_01655 [Balneolaceae bacterium ANBcel3]|nr:hypothetical protein [Balneolaceae bacterium ANBcel3]